VTVAVRLAALAFSERQELVAEVDEGHPRYPSAQRELEDRPVERERVLERPDLEGDVVDADRARPGHSESRKTASVAV
jgi:hypothetical protein